MRTLYLISILSLASCGFDNESHLKTEDAPINDNFQNDSIGELSTGEWEPSNGCYKNPVINCFGASLGNYLNAYYIVGEFNTFYAFIDNSAKRRYTKSELERWFRTIHFGYEIDFTNRINQYGDYGELVYITNINNTRGRLILPYVIENDSAKLKLASLDKDIDNQLERDVETNISAFSSLKEKLIMSSFEVKHVNPTALKIVLPESLHFGSGKFELSQNGEKSLNELVAIIDSSHLKLRQIMCIGYADSDKISQRTATYRDNLDLSALRASTVATALSRGLEFPLNQIRVQGMGEQITSDFEKHSARRVEVLIEL